MTELEEVWRRRTDEQVHETLGSVKEYTEQGRDVIRAEALRRGIIESPARAIVEPSPPPWSRLWVTMAVHVMALPLQLVLSAVGIEGSSEQINQFIAFQIALWVGLLVMIVYWWRQGRAPLWHVPILWAVMIGMVIFIPLLVFPSFRRVVVPPPVVHES